MKIPIAASLLVLLVTSQANLLSDKESPGFSDFAHCREFYGQPVGHHP